ncbi:flagellar biosynthesis protein FlhB [Quadrisphaera sp. DSM 44207]|uniref:EscU/YscU/HrcU family type III secretion system export apparatus switch protein n=1 Tax=Quadrisphaera sp. DSM 44207 TaxID=1881057 RepID=UPI0008805957|nr:EscU/YscU/HrcU family type III secretion system export apparatus switch protein [Quadrisphaera sp. DSM 44207]SDQ19716.1 flagellar biosynthetic protein FlhB [Quadrisphaera sp. DSM 44207]
MSGGEDKTEKPTAKKLKEARQQGQVARSPDLGAWLGLGAAAAVLPVVIAEGRERTERMLAGVADVARDPEPAMVLAALGQGAGALLPVLGPLLAVTVVVAIAASAGQGGIHVATKAAKPSAKNLHLLKGLKRLFGPAAWWQGAKALLKTVAVAFVLQLTIRELAPLLLTAGSMPLSSTLEAVSGGTASMLRTAVAVGLVLAAADYAVTRRRITKQLRMTRKEVQDEHKQSEGDPQLKGAIRSKQMAMSRNRMMAEVQKADVVLVNPTHVAVALRYDKDRGAPRVVAKGAGHVAARIRERATEHRVPMVADVPLARALHAACELDQEIPPHLYAAVARVLAFVMALRRRGSAAGVHRAPSGSALPA